MWLILRKISCRISWRHCFLDPRSIYWDIWQKSPNLPILVAKSVFLWTSYWRQTIPIWQDCSPLKRLQKDILFVSELLLDPELLSVLFQIFSKNLENFFVHCLELLSVKQFTANSWWVLSSSEWRFHRLRNFGGAQTFSVFFLRVFAKNLLKIDKFDEFLVGIDRGRGQIFIGIIHNDHTVSVNPCGIDPDYWGPHWYRFWTPLRKNVPKHHIGCRGRSDSEPVEQSSSNSLRKVPTVVTVPSGPSERWGTYSDRGELTPCEDIRGNVLKKSIFCWFRVWKELISEIFSKPRRADLNSYSCSTRKTECVEWFWARSEYYSRSLTLLDTRLERTQ